MTTRQFVKAPVTAEMKARVRALAEERCLTESIWLKQVVTAALKEAPMPSAARALGRPSARLKLPHTDLSADGDEPGLRVCIRVRPEDRPMLRDRAAARGMASATYVSILLRSHLRHLTPLPKEELQVLKRAVAELGAVGRNLNQIARAATAGRVTGPAKEEIRVVLKICEVLRDHTKGLIRKNVESWEAGHAERQG
ncbi:MAG: hypothetical protein CMLOHMNK_01816 [Steroidobacteraceae bacterium]|nr:hypothetical protein [Steroidobacteraceae bacterium]